MDYSSALYAAGSAAAIEKLYYGRPLDMETAKVAAAAGGSVLAAQSLTPMVIGSLPALGAAGQYSDTLLAGGIFAAIMKKGLGSGAPWLYVFLEGAAASVAAKTIPGFLPKSA